MYLMPEYIKSEEAHNFEKQDQNLERLSQLVILNSRFFFTNKYVS